MIRSAILSLMTVWLLLPQPAAAQAAHAQAQSAGIIQELDIGAQTMVIDGVRYGVARDVEVEIDGSYGAFTMLQPGMRVYYEFQRVSPTERLVTLVRELPDGVELKGV